MLDLHAVTITPGAVLVLGAASTTITAGGDGAATPYVPNDITAQLIQWGVISPTADTIAIMKMQSQDSVDPINGETLTPGAASLLNIMGKYTFLDYKSGPRIVTAGTNTGVVAGMAWLLDYFEGGEAIKGSRFMDKQIVTPAVTYGGALTANTWLDQAYTPATAMPNGKYAILGAWVSAIANGALLRFRHNSFNNRIPGIPVANYETISTATWDKIDKTELLHTQSGYQFVYLSEITGKPCCPVFNQSNAGTGLVINMAAAQADTPVVYLNLAKVD